ncbi:uncharacterized protein TNCV_4107721 [Trichonephila clavipes]|nr:uncharacterized protein TNCV_4107721 [Trichonephila clavipes]
MTVLLKDRALLVKLFYKNNDCAPIARQKFRTLKGRKKGVRLMTAQDEAHSYLTGYVNIQNCRIWVTKILLATRPVPLHPAKVTVWCWLMTSFIIGLYFFKETDAFGPVTVTDTGQHYECLLCNHVIPDLQKRSFVNGIIFMQDGDSPHIANPVKQRLKGYFGSAIVICHHFIQSPITLS